VTKFAPHKALKLIARGKLTCGDRLELHRVDFKRRWSTTLSSKVNLSHVIDLTALCGADLVTQHTEFEGERNPRTSPSGYGRHNFSKVANSAIRELEAVKFDRNLL